jgi:hypothetical protein
LYNKSDETTARAGQWTTEEDVQLKDAVEKHEGKDWTDIAALVPGRTKKQCAKRWQYVLDSKSDEMTARNASWTTDEDSSLIDAVDKYNGADWAAISSLVLGRSKMQCHDRWVKRLNPCRITLTEVEHGTTNEAHFLG